MKGKLYWFVALIGGCALFLLSPLYGTYAYFTDTKTIDTALTLKLLSVTTNDVTITTNKLNTTVTGDVTATVSGFNGEVNLSLADDATKWEDYFSIELPTLTNGQSQQIKVTKKKNLPASYNGALTLTIHDTVKLSDGSDVIVGSSTLTIEDEEYISEDNEEWPSDDKFQKGYYVAQELYYSQLNGFKTIVPAVIYLAYTDSFSTESALNQYIEALKNSFVDQSNQTIAIKYIANKGFKITVSATSYSYIKFNKNQQYNVVSKSLLKTESFYLPIMKELLFNSDFAFYNSGVKLDTSIYTRSTGVTLNYATQKESSEKILATLSNLSSYATWQVSDTNNFTITAQSDTSVTIKQNSSSGGKTAMLQLVSKSDQTVLFERQIVSVNEEATETLKNEYEVMAKIETSTMSTAVLKEVTGTSSITTTVKYNTTVKLVGNGKYYAIPIIFKITNDQGGPVKGFSTFDFAINYEGNQSKGFWTGDSSNQTPYTKVYSADAQYLKVIVYKEVSTPNQGNSYGYLKFRLLTIPSGVYTESNSGNVRFGFYHLDLRDVRSLSQSRMMITDKSAVSKGATTNSNTVVEATTEATAETSASSEEVQTTTSTSSEETTSDSSTTSTTTDDATETTTSSEETVASQ